MKIIIPSRKYREQRFVDPYTVSGKGTQSAIDAGYSVNGVDVTAARLLGRARVREAIDFIGSTLAL